VSSPFGVFAGIRLGGCRCHPPGGLLGDHYGEQCWSGCLGGVWAAVEAYGYPLRSYDSWLFSGDLLWRTSLYCSCIGGL